MVSFKINMSLEIGSKKSTSKWCLNSERLLILCSIYSFVVISKNNGRQKNVKQTQNTSV